MIMKDSNNKINVTYFTPITQRTGFTDNRPVMSRILKKCKETMSFWLTLGMHAKSQNLYYFVGIIKSYATDFRQCNGNWLILSSIVGTK